jgi:hypothetical protein
MNEEELMRDLQAADAAGDTKLANHIAGLIKAQRKAPGTPREAIKDARRQARAGVVAAASGPSPEYDPTSDNPRENAVAAVQKAGSDRLLGIQQTVAGLGGPGDPAALAQEAAQRKVRDKPLQSTVGGAVGKVADVAMGALPQLGVAKAVGMLPKLAGYAAAVPGYGAVEALTQPTDTERSVGSRALGGAAQMVGGDIAGRGLARAVRPAQNINPGALADTKTLEGGGFNNLLLENRVDSPFVQWMTGALSRTPFSGVPKARQANLERFTEVQSAPTGTQIKQVTPPNVTAMKKDLTDASDAFRAGREVPMGGVEGDLLQAADKIRKYSEATSNLTGVKKLEAAAEGVAGPAFNPQVAAILQAPGPKLSANEAFNRRSAASKLAHAEGTRAGGDPILAAQYRQMRDLYDDAIKATHQDKGVAFDAWKKKWGAYEDFTDAAAKPGGTTRAGELSPQVYAAGLDKERRLMPKTGEDEVAMAAERAVPTNRGQTGFGTGIGMGLTYGLPVTGAFTGSMIDNPAPAAAGVGLAALLNFGLGSKMGGKWATGQYDSKLARDLTDPQKLKALINALNAGSF